MTVYSSVSQITCNVLLCEYKNYTNLDLISSLPKRTKTKLTQLELRSDNKFIPEEMRLVFYRWMLEWGAGLIKHNINRSIRGSK